MHLTVKHAYNMQITEEHVTEHLQCQMQWLPSAGVCVVHSWAGCMPGGLAGGDPGPHFLAHTAAATYVSTEIDMSMSSGACHAQAHASWTEAKGGAGYSNKVISITGSMQASACKQCSAGFTRLSSCFDRLPEDIRGALTVSAHAGYCQLLL